MRVAYSVILFSLYKNQFAITNIAFKNKLPQRFWALKVSFIKNSVKHSHKMKEC